MFGPRRLQGGLHFCVSRWQFGLIQLAQNGITFVGANLLIMLDNLRRMAH